MATTTFDVRGVSKTDPQTVTRSYDEGSAEKSRSPQHGKAQKASAAEKRLERGVVMLPRAGTIPDVALRPGSAKCQCGRCGFVFSALTAFDAHQTLNDDGNVQCWEPASIGMVCRGGVWGKPESPVWFARKEG